MNNSKAADHGVEYIIARFYRLNVAFLNIGFGRIDFGYFDSRGRKINSRCVCASCNGRGRYHSGPTTCIKHLFAASHFGGIQYGFDRLPG